MNKHFYFIHAAKTTEEFYSFYDHLYKKRKTQEIRELGRGLIT